MSYAYASRILLPEGIGHLAADRVRDAVEDAVKGAVDPGEAAHVTLDGERELTLVLTTDAELGDNAGTMMLDAVREAIQDCLEPGETVAVEPFELRAYPGSAPGL